MITLLVRKDRFWNNYDFSDYAKITDFNGLSSAVPTLTMEDCNTNDCPDLYPNCDIPKWESLFGNYTCPNNGEPKPACWNPEESTTTPSTTSTTTTVATTPTTTPMIIIQPPVSGASCNTVFSLICILFSMLLAI